MLPLSYVVIPLGQSNDYKRLTCILHAIAWWAMVYAAPSTIILVMGSACLCVYLFTMLRCGRPAPSLVSVDYRANQWHLMHKTGRVRLYEKAHIRLDAGLFILLTFTGPDTKQDLVIFNDQLCQDTRRSLIILCKTL